MIIFEYLDHDKDKLIFADDFMRVLIPEYSTVKENCILALFYTINHKLGNSDFNFDKLIYSPEKNQYWKKLEPLISRDLIDFSLFHKHPNVQKGNSSEHTLNLEFKNKIVAFFEFYQINKMNYFELKRFFEFYIPEWMDDEFLWNVVHRVFQVKCVSFKSLQTYKFPFKSDSSHFSKSGLRSMGIFI